MEYYQNQSHIYANRANRRKNKIKSAPKAPKSNYSNEELERLIKKELTALINEPYSETLKREKYQRLQPFIETYQKQQVTSQVKKQTLSNSRNEKKRYSSSLSSATSKFNQSSSLPKTKSATCQNGKF